MRRIVLLAAFWIVASAHVGSPNVVFDGNAGPYPVRVIVQPPNVVPGLAEIIVRVNASDVQRVMIRPVFWRTGVAGAPRADEAKPVAGETRLYSGQLWLMSRGAYSVYVSVDGARGAGTAIVPVTSLATARLGMSRPLAAILIALAVFLFAGLVTIVRAAAGEAVLPPGETVDASARRRANWFALIATPIFALILVGGAKWWNSVDANYRRTMYRPPAVDAEVRGHELLLRVHDTAPFRSIIAPVIPDHGKMMHLFLIEAGSHARLFHLHPVQTDSLRFAVSAAGLPKGMYRVFGDLALENGMSQTVTTTLNFPGDTAEAIHGGDFEKTDDSWWPLCCNQVGTSDSRPVNIAHGYTMRWTGGNTPIVAQQAVDLRFEVRDDHNEIARLLPYLGMAAHAVVLSADESVFVHLHPMGTISTAAQQAFVARDRGDSTSSGRLHVAADTTPMTMQMDGHLDFPYEFPKAGRYRIWVQVRPPYAQVLTGAFDIDVRAKTH